MPRWSLERVGETRQGATMNVWSLVAARRAIAGACVVAVCATFATSAATAGPVVREMAAANATGIQPIVDLFRSDLGNPNNGATPGPFTGGRREINWDGGGAATPAPVPTPFNGFSNRGAVFVTPGSGFTQSLEFVEINPTYPTIFGVFSPLRLFAPLNTNVTDVIFTVPGTTNVPAGVTGFGAVFTDVDSPTSTKMEFYTPDGELLYEKFVLMWDGNESFSFLGVSFNAGEIIGRVRITTGNAALGPNEAAGLDLVAMDDFFYSEPVVTQGLTISPGSGTLSRTGGFDIVVTASNLPASIVSGKVLLNGADITSLFLGCVTSSSGFGANTFRCAPARGFLTPGEHIFQVELQLSNNSRVRNAVRWTITP
jgi:hypothetical protein